MGFIVKRWVMEAARNISSVKRKQIHNSPRESDFFQVSAPKDQRRQISIKEHAVLNICLIKMYLLSLVFGCSWLQISLRSIIGVNCNSMNRNMKVLKLIPIFPFLLHYSRFPLLVQKRFNITFLWLCLISNLELSVQLYVLHAGSIHDWTESSKSVAKQIKKQNLLN